MYAIRSYYETPSVADTKEILDLVDALPVLTPEQIALTGSLSQAGLAPLAAMINSYNFV